MRKCSEPARESYFGHAEHILQLIWQQQFIDQGNLFTHSGEKVTIISPGKINHADGPDFKHAVLLIGTLKWHGDVEIHTNPADWYEHRHHENVRFNSVILHVYAHESHYKVRTKSGDEPFSLNILPHINKQFYPFLKSGESDKGLPCTKSRVFISSEAFIAQLKKAQTEYLEKKVQDFYEFYPTSNGLEESWKMALNISFFDHLGIPHNRDRMIRAGRYYHSRRKQFEDISDEHLKKQVSTLFINSGNYTWNRKGNLPSGRPYSRLIQAIKLSNAVQKTDLSDFYAQDYTPHEKWIQLMSLAGLKSTARFNTLFTVVFLPALYALGQLTGSGILPIKVQEAWQKSNIRLPESIINHFLPFIPSGHSFTYKAGLVHQFKSYCKPRKCDNCLVLKKAIYS